MKQIEHVGPEAEDASAGMRLGHLVKVCEQALMSAKASALKPSGLTVAQYVALLFLHENPGISGAALARLAGVTAQSTVDVLAALEKNGLITRIQSDAHAKVLLAKLTPSGKKVLRKADAAAREVEAQLIATYTGEEVALLRRMLAQGTATLNNVSVVDGSTRSTSGSSGSARASR